MTQSTAANSSREADTRGGSKRSKSDVVKAVRPSALAALSQALGLAQVLLLIYGPGAGVESDAFFYLFAWGQLPIQIVLLGVLYPMWLRSSPLSRRVESFILVAVAVLSVGACIVASVVLISLGKSYPDLWIHAALIAVFSVISVLAWSAALRKAAVGVADWLSSISLLPSAFACIGLLLFGETLTLRVTVLCVGLVVGAIAFVCIFYFVVGLGFSTDDGSADFQEVSSFPKSALWFGTKSLSGYGAGLGLQSVAVTLPAAGLTLIGVLSRLVSGFATIVTNTILPRLVHKSTSTGVAAIYYCWISVIACGVLGAVTFGLRVVFDSEYYSYGLIVIAWICGAAVAASIQRVTMKFLDPSYSAISIFFSILVTVAMTLICITSGVTVGMVLAAYCLLEVLIGFVLCIVLRKYSLAIATAAVCCVLLALGTGGI